MRTNPLNVVPVALAAACVSSSAVAWGPDGHQIVATIATSYLTPEAAAQMRDLLGDETVADASNWADKVRSDKSYDWLKPYHYIDLPRKAVAVDMKRDENHGVQVITGIIKYHDILADASRPKAERLEALRLVIHFVGDIHQPFHVSYTDDKGGNGLSVLAWGKKSNMHRVFDSDLIGRRLKDTKGGWATMSADLRTAITDKQRAEWAASRDPLAWANESFELTRRAYREQPDPRTGIDDGYWKRWMPVVNQRLATGGVRLAEVLNDAFGKAAKSTAPDAKAPPAVSPAAPAKAPSGQAPAPKAP